MTGTATHAECSNATKLLFELSKPRLPLRCRLPKLRRATPRRSRNCCPRRRWPRRRRRCRNWPSRTSSAISSTSSTLNMSVDTHFYPLGLVHDEVQSQAERAAGRPAGHGRPASLSAARRRCKGCLELLYAGAADAGRDRRPAGRLAAAGGRGPRRVDGPAGGGGLFPRPRAEAVRRAHSRRRPRHQSGQRRDGRLPAPCRSRARPEGSSTSTTWPPSSTTSVAVLHDHQSEHAGDVRAADRRDRPAWSTTSAAWSISTGPT